MNLDLEQLNKELRDKSAADIIRWAVGLGEPMMASTSFSPNSAVMLKLVTEAAPAMPVVWADSGYNVPDTYRVAEQLIKLLKPNLKVYIPEMTAERRNALMGGIPHPDDNPELHKEFTRQVKLEPFDRAFKELAPKIWVTGIRKEETAFRQGLDILSWDGRGILKVAPIFYWSEQDVLDYMQSHQLPSCKHYFDPTKIAENRECGLHTSA
ncbi:phosphoadenosine phosphosulfate reductase family protein [Spongiibacter taiwanensis]|uniref:phosphoadenosine phosphosulfate reductase domain-containing protein n=1 Tax=Spongiibacter taiwanensis TaxID=1748242 RepID=UPI0020359CE2|nr:phosphoadenosine phosphosulfate reductase family protein [Spongiibacter taiwanensis]USA43703.1 phosphoadenosine phosphosulfate reductase family protein [Spongiibacter taiwanensis]